jgi:dTDP-4-dehydrorhamnose reductase
MKIFVSGASGLVGGNCLSYFKEVGCDIVGSHLSFPTRDTVYFNTLQLDDANNFDLYTYHPDVIVHCGALTHVDYCESHVEESFEKTVQSTLNLIDLAQKLNSKLVFLSTDYVFDGKEGPYKESNAVNPLSVYGKHKLEAEQAIEKSGLDYLILRVTNVYGDEIRNKNFIARIVNQCKNGQELTLKLPYDQFASPTNARDIARAMYDLLQHSKNGIYHICSSDYMNRVELAMKVLKYFPQAKYNLEAISTVSLQQPAARPLLGGFVKAKFVSEFPNFIFTNVDDYLKKQLL